MRLAIVHLTDLHITANDNPILSRINAIANAIPSVTPEDLEVILAWTGDIAYSGKREQYGLAASLIDGIESTLRLNPQITFLGSVFIPGNHDCDFSQSGDARGPLLDSLGGHLDQLDVTGATVEQITKPQDEFFNFLHSRGIRITNRLSWEQTFHATQTDVFVRCCNSSWTSRLEETPSLLFPPNAISESPAPFTITLLHHPFTWFDPINGKTLRRKLEIDSDLILTGHEHDPDTFSRSGIDSSTRYLEGGALAAANVQTSFSVSLVDLPGSSIQTFTFNWADPLYSRATDFTSPFVRKQRAIVNRFIRSAEFERKVEEITTPFTHPRKELRLSDIYVQPPLTEIVPSLDGKTSEQVVPAEGVLDYILSEKIVRISGQTGYGKSSLASILCRDLLDLHSIVPVYLDATLISGQDLAKVVSSIERAFGKQYEKHLLEHYRQLPRSNKAVIFDDWGRVRLNDHGKQQMLRNLASCADCIVLFDDVSPFLRQIDDLNLDEGVPKPKQCELRQFGYQLRGSLIEKWHLIGRAFEVSEGAFAHDVSVSDHLLNGLIGRGVMPSTPLFILSALQMQQEASNTGGDYGSYGHIYQALITSRLSKKSNKTVALKINFLSMVAFKMFEDQVDSLNFIQIKELARKYDIDYNYEFDPNELLKDIADSGLINYDGDTIKFEYRYVYYYSVAYAFKTMANDQMRNGAREHLTRLANEAYFDDNANILIFYMYLSKDRALMEEVLANAANIFSSAAPCNLESDLDFVNELLNDPLPLPEPSHNLLQNITEHRTARDEAAATNKPKPSPASQSDKEISEIDFAMRSLEIMGQVLKNFPTDLRADLKSSLTKESYALGLRTMGSFLAILRTNRDKFRESLSSHLAKESAFAEKTISQKQETIDSIIIFFAQLAIFGILKKVSDALGTEDLRHTFDQVRTELGETQIATRLIDLSIRLDHFGTLPESDIFDLEKRLRGNSAGWRLLSLLIAQHIALFPTQWKVRQKLVDTFKFSRTTGLPSPKQLIPS